MLHSKKNYNRTKHSCYYTYLAMSSIFSLPPILFMTFREMYEISYTLLGTLVAINFCTQLSIDLIFTFFTKYFNIRKTIIIMPVLTSIGLFVYAFSPLLFPGTVYVGFVIGTILFSIAAGFCEVLLSPLVAALPSDNPERDMSTLHSLYGYGVVTVVVVSTLFLQIFGRNNWMYLTMFYAVLPLISFLLYIVSPIPEINMEQNMSTDSTKRKRAGLMLCVMCIFLGSAAENTMTNWISAYMENVLYIPKVWGDILGMAIFAILLAITRTLYAKYGKNITNMLLYSMMASVICYLVAGFSPNSVVAALACAFTGVCTSMLWPGTLILMEEKVPNPGVAAYALMAAGGDLGASIAPQMLGVIVDKVSVSNWATNFSTTFSLTTEQIGMKTGMLIAALFPILGTILLLYIKKNFSKQM